MKPLGRKAYGSIPHLPGSRRGLRVDLPEAPLLVLPDDVGLIVDGLQFGSLYHLSDLDTAAGCVYPDDYGTGFTFREIESRQAWRADYGDVHALAHYLRTAPVPLEACSW